LNATLLISSILEKFGVKIPMKDFFKNPTINGVKNYCIEQGDNFAEEQTANRPKQKAELSPAQHRLYIINQTNPDSVAYNMPSAFWLKGEVDLNKIRTVINEIINRHQSLRTSFVSEGGRIYQEVVDEISVDVVQKEIKKDHLESNLKEFVKPFDLSRAPLVRVGVFKVNADHLFVIDMHHIVADIVSISILIREFLEVYNDRNLKNIEFDYLNYFQWEIDQENSAETTMHEDFWLDQYKELPKRLNLPSDFSRPKKIDYEGDSIEVKLDEDLSRQIKLFLKENGLTPFMFFIGLYYLFLYKISGSSDVVIGIPSINRKKMEFRNIVGNFLNTVPIRFNGKMEQSVREILLDSRDVILDCFEHQDYQYERLINRLNFKREEGKVALFDTLFNFIQENDLVLQSDKLDLLPYKLDNQTTKFDLSCYAVEIKDSFVIKFNYRKSIFKRSTVQCFHDSYCKLIRQVLKAPDQQVFEQKIFDSVKYFNNDQVDVLDDDSKEFIVEAIESNIKKYQNKTCIINDGESYSFSQFDQLASVYAGRLVTEYKRENKGQVFILLDMNYDLVVMMYALYRSRIPFCVIDPIFPVERILKLIENVDKAIVVSDFEHLSLLEQETLPSNATLINYYTIEQSDEAITSLESATENNSSEIKLNRDDNDLAFTIYTSGSTGEPKGVCHSYSNFNYYIKSYIDNGFFNADDTLALLTHPAHAVGLIDAFTSLLVGMPLNIYNIRVPSNFSKLAVWLDINKVTVLHTVPTVYRCIINQMDTFDLGLENIKLVVLGGEEVARADFSNFKKRFPRDSVFVNFYGASEVLAISFLELKQDDTYTKSRVSSGKVIRGTDIKILDRSGFPLEYFGVGEIVVCNDFLAKGYLNNEQIEQNHVTLVNCENEIIGYKTGDLGRCLPNGEIEVIGRINDWTKLRGFRVDFSEIEEALMEIEGISMAVVFTNSYPAGDKEDKNEYLAAMYLGDHDLKYNDIKSVLVRKLPSYMIPLNICCVDKFPLNQNGKFDKRMARKVISTTENKQERLMPTKGLEIKIAEVWKKVLQLDVVGINDTFFDLGGDSVKLVDLMVLLSKELGRELPVETIFEYPTIQSLVEFLNSDTDDNPKLSDSQQTKNRINRMRGKK
jgi:non-ribosomal peptide synthetase component F/acyl carrier protein